MQEEEESIWLQKSHFLNGSPQFSEVFHQHFLWEAPVLTGSLFLGDSTAASKAKDRFNGGKKEQRIRPNGRELGLHTSKLALLQLLGVFA